MSKSTKNFSDLRKAAGMHAILNDSPPQSLEKVVKLTFYLDPLSARSLDLLAAAHGLSRSAFVAQVLKKELSNEHNSLVLEAMEKVRKM